MRHYTATVRTGLLFETWEEAERLWSRLRRALPDAGAICMLPHHIEVIAAPSQARALARALLLHTRSLGRPYVSTQIRTLSETSARALYAAPCLRGLCRDPLDWTWSTYREAMGLIPGAAPSQDPEALHSETCRLSGVQTTPMPTGLNFPSLEQVRDAVSAASRTPISRMHRPGPHRALWISAARQLCQHSEAQLMAAVGAGPLAMMQATAEPAWIAQVAALAGDPRFPGLASGRGPWLNLRAA